MVSNGGFAETLLIKEENLYRVPDTISDEVMEKIVSKLISVKRGSATE